MKYNLIQIGLFLCLVLTSYAANIGGLDPSFGSAGAASYPVPSPSPDNIGAEKSLLRLPSGHFLTVGSTLSNASSGQRQWAIARFTPDGQVDASFGQEGRVFTSFASGRTPHQHATAIALQPDGKIIVVGGTDGPSKGNRSYFGVARYLSNGVLDASFGIGGKVRIELGKHDVARSVLVQNNGRVVIAGSSRLHEYLTQIALVRLTPTGALDKEFSGDGKLLLNSSQGIPYDSDLHEYPVCLMEDEIGNLLIGTTIDHLGDVNYKWPCFTVIKLTAGGIPVASFGDNGIAEVDVDHGTGLGISEVRSMIALPDGDIVLAGCIDESKAMVKFKSTGVLDEDFGVAGIFVGAAPGGFDTTEKITAIVTTPTDGLMALVLREPSSGARSAYLQRYLATGSLDSSFGGNNGLELYIPDDELTTVAGPKRITSLVLQSDGSTVCLAENGGANPDFILLRVSPTATLDTGFGQGGRTQFDLESQSGYAVMEVLTESEDGKIYGAAGTDQGLCLWRMHQDGKLDSSFGSGGRVRVNSANYLRCVSIWEHQDGSLFIAGDTPTSSDSNLWLGRLNSDGSFYSSFGIGGTIELDGGGIEALAGAVALGTDIIYLVCNSKTNLTAQNDLILVKLQTDGSLVTSYGNGGYYHHALASGFAINQLAEAVTADDRDGFYVAGDVTSSLGLSMRRNIFVAKFTGEGALDSAFSEDGYAAYSAGLLDHVEDISMASYEKILICGSTFKPNSAFSDSFVLRIHETGNLDTAFGSGGRVITSFSTRNDTLIRVEQSSYQDIYACGNLEVNTSRSHAFVQRLTPRGIPDKNFDGNGKVYATNAVAANFMLHSTYDHPIFCGAQVQNMGLSNEIVVPSMARFLSSLRGALSVEYPVGQRLYDGQRIDFGNTFSARQIIVSLKNRGSAAISGLRANWSEGSSSQFQKGKLSTTALLPGQTRLLTLDYQPTPGTHAATLRIYSANDDTIDLKIQVSASTNP